MSRRSWGSVGDFWRTQVRVAAVVVYLVAGMRTPSASSTAANNRLAALIVVCLLALALHALWWWWRQGPRFAGRGLDRDSAARCLWTNWLSVGPPLLAALAVTLLVATRLGLLTLPAGELRSIAEDVSSAGVERLVWLAGLGLIPALWFGRYVEYGPHCAACGYSAAGVELYQCAECGAPLGGSERLVPGKRVRSARVTIVAVAIFVVSLASAPMAPRTPWARWMAARAPLEVSLATLAARATSNQGEIWLGIERRFPLSGAETALAVDRLLDILERTDPPALHWAALDWLGAALTTPSAPVGSIDRALAISARAPSGYVADTFLRAAARAAPTGVQARAVDELMLERLREGAQVTDLAAPWLADRVAEGALARELVESMAELAGRSDLIGAVRESIGHVIYRASHNASTVEAWADVRRLALADIARTNATAGERWEGIEAMLRAARAGELSREDLDRMMAAGVGPWVLSGLVHGELPAPQRGMVVDVAIEELRSTPSRATGDLRAVWSWLRRQRDAGGLSEFQLQSIGGLERLLR